MTSAFFSSSSTSAAIPDKSKSFAILHSDLSLQEKLSKLSNLEFIDIDEIDPTNGLPFIFALQKIIMAEMGLYSRVRIAIGMPATSVEAVVHLFQKILNQRILLADFLHTPLINLINYKIKILGVSESRQQQLIKNYYEKELEQGVYHALTCYAKQYRLKKIDLKETKNNVIALIQYYVDCELSQPLLKKQLLNYRKNYLPVFLEFVGDKEKEAAAYLSDLKDGYQLKQESKAFWLEMKDYPTKSFDAFSGKMLQFLAFLLFIDFLALIDNKSSFKSFCVLATLVMLLFVIQRWLRSYPRIDFVNLFASTIAMQIHLVDTAKIKFQEVVPYVIVGESRPVVPKDYPVVLSNQVSQSLTEQAEVKVNLMKNKDRYQTDLTSITTRSIAESSSPQPLIPEVWREGLNSGKYAGPILFEFCGMKVYAIFDESSVENGDRLRAFKNAFKNGFMPNHSGHHIVVYRSSVGLTFEIRVDGDDRVFNVPSQNKYDPQNHTMVINFNLYKKKAHEAKDQNFLEVKNKV